MAAIAEEMLGADDKALTRLVQKKPGVARRIVDTIRNVIEKFRGAKDPQLDAMRRAEKYMRKALDEVEGKRRAEYKVGAQTETNADMQYAAKKGRTDYVENMTETEYDNYG